MNLKNTLRKLHRWLGLWSGLVVFVVSLTGCIYVFADEIGQFFESGVWMKVEPRPEPVAPLSVWMEKARAAHGPAIRNQGVEYYPARDLAVIDWIRDSTGYTAYIQDPYTGDILRAYKYTLSFWAVIISLHVSLAIPVVGVHIVGISTFIFAAMLLTGLVLWWPRTLKASRPRLLFQWNKANWKRKTWDLHLILGFYSSFALLFVALTGLAMAYGWVDKGIYRLATIAGADTTRSDAPFDTAAVNARAAPGGAVATAERIVAALPDAYHYRYFSAEADSMAYLSAASRDLQRRGGSDGYALHKATGRVTGYRLAHDGNAGEFLHEANLPIHTGAFLGLPGKILAFLVSFVAATLPITGFLMWWGKQRKRRPSAAA